MIFTIKADAEFKADNIDDAFVLLSEYFHTLYDSGDIELASKRFLRGNIEIKPKKPKESGK